jgi:hypothetical protein
VLISISASFTCIFVARADRAVTSLPLPPYPRPEERSELFLILGEQHHRGRQPPRYHGRRTAHHTERPAIRHRHADRWRRGSRSRSRPSKCWVDGAFLLVLHVARDAVEGGYVDGCSLVEEQRRWTYRFLELSGRQRQDISGVSVSNEPCGARAREPPEGCRVAQPPWSPRLDQIADRVGRHDTGSRRSDREVGPSSCVESRCDMQGNATA